ncbi:MAG: hypothetical protein R3F46_12400 [bacterium]
MDLGKVQDTQNAPTTGKQQSPDFEPQGEKSGDFFCPKSGPESMDQAVIQRQAWFNESDVYNVDVFSTDCDHQKEDLSPREAKRNKCADQLAMHENRQ